MIFTFSISALAYGHDNHDKILLSTSEPSLFFPFHEHDLKTGTKIEEIKTVLCYACYISIDQHNTNQMDDEKLKKLKDYGVKGLPKSISDSKYQINATGDKHRRFTHRGWDPDKDEINYNPEELIKWEYRKSILENTVDKIFDFDGDLEKRDSFCALLYYVHILGDKESDCNNKKVYEYQREILEVGGRNDKSDIIDELIYYLEKLFKDQKHTPNYNYIMDELKIINSKLKPVVSDVSKLRNSESDEFRTYTECTKQTLALLKSDNISLLLKSENFFNEVFYNHPY